MATEAARKVVEGDEVASVYGRQERVSWATVNGPFLALGTTHVGDADNDWHVLVGEQVGVDE